MSNGDGTAVGTFILGIIIGVFGGCMISLLNKDWVTTTTWARATNMCMINKGAGAVEAKMTTETVLVVCNDGTVMRRNFSE